MKMTTTKVVALVGVLAVHGTSPSAFSARLSFVLAVGILAPLGLQAQSLSDLPGVIVRSAGIAGVEPLTFDLEAESTQRFALVIGNGEYDNVPDLPNAVADAKLMALTLRANGYVVSEHHNIDKLGFENALRQILFESEVGAELLIFYAGHGVQVGDRNYILPTDSAVDSVNDLPFQTVSLQNLLALASSRARSLIAILDSCRDNPFPDKLLSIDLDGVPSSIRSGFNPQEAPVNSLIVFSTAPGAVALDGAGENSPFTSALVDALDQYVERSFDDLLRDIRRDVYTRTNGLQLPWQSSSLVEPLHISQPREALDIPELASRTEVNSINLSSPYMPKIAVGEGFLGSLMDTESQHFAIVSAPSHGRMEVEQDGRLAPVVAGATLFPDELENLIYRPLQTEGLPNQRGVKLSSDLFEIQSDQILYRVDVSLSLDQCDIEASDYLDPEGVGRPVYPNELRPDEALAACLAAVEGDPDVGRFHYQLGRAYVALRDLEAAEAAFMRANELGHTRALQGLGLLEIAKEEESIGISGGRAPEAALAYFAAGVERGDPYAYHSLGLQLLRNPTSAVEQRQGFELLSRALEVGHTFSMNALGLYFLDEEAEHYDPLRGLRYLEGSAEREDIYGIANLGFVYANGLADQDKDAPRARGLFEEAAAQGHPTAPVSLGRLFFSGDLPGGSDTRRAIEWFDEGLSRGDGWGGANAAWVITNRDVPGYTDFDAAARAAKAATLGDLDAREMALDLLGNLNDRTLDGGAQALMADLGVAISVDGAFGPQSRALLDELALARDTRFSVDKQERLLELARLYWADTKFRVDLN